MYIKTHIKNFVDSQKVNNISARKNTKTIGCFIHDERKKNKIPEPPYESEKYEILYLIIEGKIEGKRSVGRPQTSWTKDLRRWIRYNSLDNGRHVDLHPLQRRRHLKKKTFSRKRIYWFFNEN